MHELYAMVRAKLERIDFDSDEDAFCQQLCVEVEQKLGTYPNLPGLAPARKLRMGDELLGYFFTNGEFIRRKSWPEGDHLSACRAEGGTIWYYCAAEDELTPGYKLGFHDLAAEDWETV